MIKAFEISWNVAKNDRLDFYDAHRKGRGMSRMGMVYKENRFEMTYALE